MAKFDDALDSTLESSVPAIRTDRHQHALDTDGVTALLPWAALPLPPPLLLLLSIAAAAAVIAFPPRPHRYRPPSPHRPHHACSSTSTLERTSDGPVVDTFLGPDGDNRVFDECHGLGARGCVHLRHH